MMKHKPISDKKIAITGANGYVAKNLRRILDNAGISAVCLARKNFSTHPLETKIVSSNYNSDKILPLLKNCTAMVHLAGSGIQSVDSDYCTSNPLRATVARPSMSPYPVTDMEPITYITATPAKSIMTHMINKNVIIARMLFMVISPAS